MTTEHDAPTPRVRVVIRGRIQGDDVVDAFARLYAEEPQATLYDRLFDLTEYEAGFEASHLQRIAAAYRAAAPVSAPACRTAFVTTDPNFDLWASAMRFQFEGRSFRAYATFEDAERYLATPLTERGT